MDLNSQKSEFSGAYFRAVVAAAGFAVADFSIDRDKVDTGVAADGDGGFKRSPRLDVQLKCTSSDILHEDGLHYSLTKDHLDALRKDRVNSLILVVLVVPPNVADWLDHTPEQLVLRRCAWWRNLYGHPGVAAGNESATVILPKHQLFCPEQLVAMMRRIDVPGGRA